MRASQSASSKNALFIKLFDVLGKSVRVVRPWENSSVELRTSKTVCYPLSFSLHWNRPNKFIELIFLFKMNEIRSLTLKIFFFGKNLRFTITQINSPKEFENKKNISINFHHMSSA